MKTSSFERHWIPRIMLLLHAVGVAGILAGYGQYFLDFTAANLFINGLLAAWADWDQRHASWILAFIGGIADRYIKLYKTLNKEEKITIISAETLSSDEQGEVLSALKANPLNAGKEFTLEFTIDETIKGGL